MTLHRATLDAFLARLAKIGEGTPRKWGSMSAHAMVVHLVRSFEIGLGEHNEPDQSNFITRSRLFRWLLVEAMPWPKGKIKAPASWTPAPTQSFAADMAALEAIIRRFVETSEREPDRTVRSPLMGPLTLRYWQKLSGIHLDHHLRQFGV